VSDVYCLTPVGDVWQVYYTERGQSHQPIFTSANEAEACAFYFDLLMGMRHEHCVGFFKEETAVHALQTTLTQHNIASHHDKIPYDGPDAPRYRVFVTGKAIFAAQAILDTIPLQD
jgi:hypothetical protein